jgi:hypothetical protein
MRLKEEGAAAVKASTDRLGQSFDATTGKAKAYDLTLGSLKGALSGLVSGFAAATVFQKIVAETSEAEFAQAQLNATLKSTKGVAGQSADMLNRHAAALSKVSTFDDDVITGAQSLLLTFTKIGGETFPQATQAVLNVATAMNTDLKSAAIQVGKALNDPIAGVSALARSGIQFSEAQKDVIAKLVETNKLAEAQTIILGELETQFGDSAKAARNTFGGALKGLGNDIGNALTLTGDGVNVATKGVQYLSTIVTGLRTALDQVINLASATYTNIVGVFRILKAMESPATYAEEYRKITNEMEASRTKFTEIYKPIADVSAISKEAAGYMGKFGNSTTVTAGAFGMFSDAVLHANKPFKQFAVNKDDATKKGKTYAELLIELAGVSRLTTTEMTALFGIEAKLFTQLGDSNIPLAKKVTLTKELVAAQAALLDQASLKMTGKVADATTRTERQQQSFTVKKITAVDPTLIANVRAQMDAVAVETERMAAETTQRLQQSFAGGVVATFADALAAGFETAIATGKISEGFKAFGSVLLSGLGGMLQQFGTAALLANKLMIKLMTSMATMNPVTGIAASIALIALGGVLKGAARSAFGGGGGGGGGGNVGGYSAPAMGGNMTMPTAYYGPTSAGSANTIERVNPISVTIIGPNDPTAQRQMQELLRNAQRRGNV